MLKILVVKEYGAGAIGEMNVRTGMPTQLGYVSGIAINSLGSGEIITVGHSPASGLHYVPANQLRITTGNAFDFGFYDAAVRASGQAFAYGHYPQTTGVYAQIQTDRWIYLNNGNWLPSTGIRGISYRPGASGW